MCTIENRVDLAQTNPKYGDKILRDFQVTGRDFLKSRRLAGLWDDMGLGKTIQSLAAASDLGLPVEVVGPPKLKLDWEAEARNLGVPLTYHSIAKIPESVESGCILIYEEAHWVQGGSQTQRGRKGMQLALNHDGPVWLLTGTPIRSGRPKNLLPLLEILGVVPEEISSWDYLQKFCGPRQIAVGRKIVTLFDGATRLPELAQLMAPVSLRRLKTEELDLPPKIYCDRVVPLSKPSFVRSKLAEFKERLAKKLEETDRLEQRESLERLLIVSQLKALSEDQKLEYCEELAEEIEGQCLWFCCYLETAAELSKSLQSPVITGETDLKTRHQIIQEFQAGKHKNLVLTIRAAGVGITLTAATTEVFVGQEWSPEDNLQAEDRAYRIGQTQPLTVFKLENSLDRHVRNLNGLKSANSNEFFQALKETKIQ